MRQKLPSALSARLAAYSAAAGVTLAYAPAPAAQIVYHDVPDTVVWDGPDLDGDGTDDFWVTVDVFYPGSYESWFVQINNFDPYSIYNNPQNGVLGYFSAALLEEGAVVGASGRFEGSALLCAGVWGPGQGSSPGSGAFTGTMGYAGFRFVAADGALHYGWARLEGSEYGAEVKVYEYAYEATPDTAIVVGDRGLGVAVEPGPDAAPGALGAPAPNPTGGRADTRGCSGWALRTGSPSIRRRGRRACTSSEPWGRRSPTSERFLGCRDGRSAVAPHVRAAAPSPIRKESPDGTSSNGGLA